MTAATDAARVAVEHWAFERGEDSPNMLELILGLRADLRELEHELKPSRRVLDEPEEFDADAALQGTIGYSTEGC